MNLLLHTCCATCLAGVITQLKEYNITCFFYNPNIHPREEYDKRLNDVKKQCDKLNIKLIQGDYDKTKWLKLTKGLENEKEGGQRCVKCYTMRLEKTAKTCTRDSLISEFDIFTTTLTISPHKKADIINKIGQDIAAGLEQRREAKKLGTKFLSADFKKHNGFKHACEISKQENFYRQNYCGCVYSRIIQINVSRYVYRES